MDYLPSHWPPGRPTMALEADYVHVWRAVLPAHQQRLPEFYATLDAEERDRAARFVFERDRQRYIISHGILRDILARYSGQAAQALRFAKNSYGKPLLLSDPGAAELQFNLSHSHELALCAVGLQHAVGVDVEALRAEFAGLDLARHIFAAAEIAALTAVPARERTQAFFNCWTRKEAYIKAVGQGLGIDLTSFVVTLSPAEPARLCSISQDGAAAAGWTMHALEVQPGYAAAVVVAAPHISWVQWDWQALPR